MIVLLVLDILSFVSLCWLFVVVMLNMAAAPDKSIDPTTLEEVNLNPSEKRVRFMWLGMASLLPMLTALLHIILFWL